MKFVILSFLIFLVLSCTTSDRAAKNWDFEYDYEIRKYDNDTLDSKNLRHIEYYDSLGKLLRVAGSDGCERCIYNNQGLLVATIGGRDCLRGVREFMIYDKHKNLLGKFRTTDSLVNLDTVKYKQAYFYDKNNKLIKELDREWNDPEGNLIEYWNYSSIPVTEL
jgi:hypothetical protein